MTYPGGASASIPFADLPANLRSEILRQPFAAAPSADPAAEGYVLLEWEDGWKEVVQVEAGLHGHPALLRDQPDRRSGPFVFGRTNRATPSCSRSSVGRGA